ncbi:MAG: carbohydrate ABC transporter permease, partial [Caldilineaceae bacterium SB0666_bin_21]|nr:carbohydrate ABC transporter permease [Caldilineaceae bacterium SB0666_bin_21]
MAAATVTSERQFRRHDFWRALLLTVLCGLQLLPLLMAFFISFKTIPQFSRVPFLPTFPLHWENYLSAWEIVRLFLFNTVFVSGLTVVGVLALGSLAAYSFAILRYPGREFLFYLVLARMMVPDPLTLV